MTTYTDLACHVGEDFRHRFLYTREGVAYSTVGVVARLDIKRYRSDATPLLSLTSPSGGINGFNSLGYIDVRILASVTRTITGSPFDAVYDMFLVWPDLTEDAVEGIFKFLRPVTVL